ncbi:hypothetical protein [Bacillus phage vB_BanS-Thrax5]|nr:hypothetical protein [Bacillus phage vB_BanS-Thrax5]
MEKRTLTVKRGLTRLNTIEAQLTEVVGKIQKYGAISSKEKVDLVDTKVARDKNHELARAEISSLYQKHQDLLAEYSKIKSAINKSNLVTNIEVGGKVISIAEALLIDKDTRFKIQQLTQAYTFAVSRAEGRVETYNARLNKENLTADELETALAQVEYLVDASEIKKHQDFLTEFIVEINGIIDESNIATTIEL